LFYNKLFYLSAVEVGGDGKGGGAFKGKRYKVRRGEGGMIISGGGGDGKWPGGGGGEGGGEGGMIISGGGKGGGGGERSSMGGGGSGGEGVYCVYVFVCICAC